MLSISLKTWHRKKGAHDETCFEGRCGAKGGGGVLHLNSRIMCENIF